MYSASVARHALACKCATCHASPVNHSPKVSREQALAATERAGSLRGAGKALGVSAGAVKRALAAKVPGRVRRKEEFSGKAPAVAQRRVPPVGCWTLEAIRNARDAQMRGDFRQAVRLCEAMRTEPAIFTARLNRLAPIQSIATKLEPANGARGEAVAKRAAASVFASKLMLEGVEATLVEHGIAIMQIRQVPNDEGTRVDFHVAEWPLEHVKWNPFREVLETLVKDGGARRDIVHGDGEWIVVRKFEILPWTQEAVLLPAAMLWAGIAYGLSDWAGALRSHGQAKMAAQLPEGSSLRERDSTGAIALGPEAAATLQTLQDMVSGEAGAGIFMAGTKVDFLANGSNAWQVFDNFISNREKSAARIYNGTDATMGSAGGAPGVDISILFGVASTKVQGDFEAIEQAMNTGAYQPWCAVNEGDSRLAPSLRFLIPDPDASAKSAEESARMDRLFAALEKYKAQGMQITQEVVAALCALFGVLVVPVLASGDTKAVPIELAPTDVAKIVRVGPALRSLGLELFNDERDAMTITELDAFNQAKAEAQKAAASAQADANAQIKVADAAPPDPRPAALAKLCKALAALPEKS